MYWDNGKDNGHYYLGLRFKHVGSSLLNTRCCNVFYNPKCSSAPKAQDSKMVATSSWKKNLGECGLRLFIWAGLGSRGTEKP